jgi:hypothetical protein
MTEPEGPISFDRARVQALLVLLERMAGGDMTAQLPLSDKRDELDAIAHAANVLSDELRWMSARMVEAERLRVAALLKGKDSGDRAAGWGRSEIFGLQPGVARDAGHHLGADLDTIVECPRIVGPSLASEGEMAARTPLDCPANSKECSEDALGLRGPPLAHAA